MVHQRDPKRLTISVVVFAIIIIVGLITLSRPKYVFTLDAQATLETILAEQEEISPYEIEKTKILVDSSKWIKNEVLGLTILARGYCHYNDIFYHGIDLSE